MQEKVMVREKEWQRQSKGKWNEGNIKLKKGISEEIRQKQKMHHRKTTLVF